MKNRPKQILQDAILNKIQIIVPSLLLDEITEVLCGNLNNLGEIKWHLHYLDTLAKQLDRRELNQPVTGWPNDPVDVRLLFSDY